MRLLVVNPNVSTSHTETIAAAAREVAAPGTSVDAVNVPFGPHYIDTRGEVVIAAYATLLALARHVDGHDAAVIAGFVDPGLGAAKEILPIPVVGIVEAACLTACLLGTRFAIVTLGPRLVPVFRDLVRGYGLSERLAAIEAVDDPDELLVKHRSAAIEPLAAAARVAIQQAGADVIVVGGAPLADIVPDLANVLDVPVIDGVRCAVRQAELLVGLGWRKSRAGSYSLPGPRPLLGVPSEIAALYGAAGSPS